MNNFRFFRTAGALTCRQQTLATACRCAVFVLSLVAFNISAGVAFAQQVTGTISGTVTDANGEAIPSAAVTIESDELAIARTATTNDEGVFSVPNLPVSTYRLKIAMEGFGDFMQEAIKVDTGSNINLPVQLRIGGVAAEVTVSDQQFQTIDKETGNVETLVSGEQVRELALNGRNWAQLLNLAPGTSSINNDSQQGTNVRIDDTAINGLRRRTSPTIDGVSNVDHGSSGTQINNISVDALQEFRLVSSPYSAEYGSQAGPAVNLVTKRGSNSFNGSLFEFIRNDALNAYSWESKQALNPQKPLLRFQNFGGFVGGPIYKDKLFFFGGLEFKRPRTGRTLSEIVPTEAMRRGDFSAFLPPGLPAGTSCAPTGFNVPAGTFILCDRSASTNGVRFANNIVPETKLSPNGRRLLNLFPLPNAGVDRFISSPVTIRNVRQELLRLDYQLNPNVTIYGRFIQDYFDSDNPLGSSFDNQALPIAPDNHIRDGRTAMVNYTHVISPTLINEAVAMWQRNDQALDYQDPAQIDRDTYGINFVELFAANSANRIPEFTVQGYSTISGNGLPYRIDAKNIELRDNVTKTLSAHVFKFGALYVNATKSENVRARDGGTITFSAGNDAGTAFRPQDAGNAVANLLLGAFTRYTEVSNTTNAPVAYNQFEIYFNDQWRVNQRLSLTLGLRYQYIPWAYARRGDIVGFDVSRFDSAKSPLQANINGSGVINLAPDPTGQRTRAQGFYDPYNGIVLPNNFQTSDPNLQRLISDRPDGIADSGVNGVAPRLGFALDPRGDGQTSIRARRSSGSLRTGDGHREI